MVCSNSPRTLNSSFVFPEIKTNLVCALQPKCNLFLTIALSSAHPCSFLAFLYYSSVLLHLKKVDTSVNSVDLVSAESSCLKKHNLIAALILIILFLEVVTDVFSS